MIQPTVSLFQSFAIGDSNKPFRTLTKGFNSSRFNFGVCTTNISNVGSKNYKNKKVTQYASFDGPEIGPLEEDPDPDYISYEPDSPLADQNGNVRRRKDKTLENSIDLMDALQTHQMVSLATSIFNKMNQATNKIDES